jgi:hypothetical protein
MAGTKEAVREGEVTEYIKLSPNLFYLPEH